MKSHTRGPCATFRPAVKHNDAPTISYDSNTAPTLMISGTCCLYTAQTRATIAGRKPVWWAGAIVVQTGTQERHLWMI